MKRTSRRVTRARATIIGVATATAAVAVTGLIAQPGNAAALPSSEHRSGQWPSAGQNISDTHFQASEHKISPVNVGRLTPRWTLTTAGAISATPAVDDGVAYVPDYGGKLWAVETGSVQVLWSKDISDYTGVAADQSRVSPAVYRDDIILGDGWIVSPNKTGAKVFAVNRHTGALDWVTQLDTDPDAVITAAPVIYRGVAYFGIASKGEGEVSPTFRGAVAAVDAATGKLLWKAYTVPSNNGGSDSNLPDGYYTGNSVWGSSPVVDPARGLLYVGTGNNYSAPTGVCQDPGQTNCTPSASDDYVDSILALRLSDGAVAWADRTNNGDIWTRPRPFGPDYDFGAGANLFTVPGTGRQLLGIGQKNGVYWAVEPATGKVVWQTVVGPTDPGHGIEYGTATDGQRVYVAEGDTRHNPYVLGGSGPYAGQTDTAGSWAALDPATGKILWQTPDPNGSPDTGPVSVANGVVYGGSDSFKGTSMYALDAATGAILWSFNSGGSVTGGAAIVGGSVYWGSGYCGTECFGTGNPLNNDKLYAFDVR